MNGFRSLVAATATALLAATATLAGATPAHAATIHSVTVTLIDGTTPGCNATTVITTSQTVVQAAPGDTLRVVFNSTRVSGQVTDPDRKVCGFALTPVLAEFLTGWGAGPFISDDDDLSRSISLGLVSTDATWEFTVGVVDVDVKVYWSDPGTQYGLIFRVMIVDRSVAGTPPDFVQQFAISTGGTCESVPSDIPVFNVSRSGGWEKSWAQWPNDGQGGFVCTRTVRYEPSIQGWVPRA